MAANERIPYDEFSMFHENAHEAGLPYGGPPAVRREFVELGDGRRLSGLVWGTTGPELVLLHGGAQNAHTWDTVALALGRPLLALDLPGHGHSDDGRHGSADVTANAEDVATAIRALAPEARGVVGMSLGGITALALARDFPSLVRAMVLVDVTPGVDAVKSKVIADFVNGPASFPDFDQILARTVAHNPGRTVSSLRRGILHNALQREDGTWVWRYRRFNGPRTEHTDGVLPQFASLWEAVSTLRAPLMLVRGMRPQSVVDDADEAELLRRAPSARVARVEEAGHSVQGDSPLELARLIDRFIA
ncbi:alpha/beta fold hydrolase [Actinomadura scrupuli]|uniref:alpha/beta fold hydrolase n=1 Tax=Actinomadura scrupuli TaxID=559629 RepID=UPI003D965E87